MPTWRPLTPNDIASLMQVANEIHPGLPERPEVFINRIALFPAGCLALEDEAEDEDGARLCGYAISHPIRPRCPPALDSVLDEIPADADHYYIHDVAILPRLRGRGLAAECVARLLASDAAQRYPMAALVSVYGTEAFWARFGFRAVVMGEDLAGKLREYGEDAVYLERVQG
ncbi:GNAT family N-acetyltransferase [Aspergillus puulaauensis]|uniref:N-acetyltransferase domain-containing protein n=1 Tax=Aspergillus puulaauensis TaxID=1220207 RepID=A0A7R8AK96_9EURO|nr:uncharacterized protein APUU_20902A [Aspergillus puulaauensis]BCS20470.1 hypothetical protein APUU_20902A [Aspergillus puulaauensis]